MSLCVIWIPNILGEPKFHSPSICRSGKICGKYQQFEWHSYRNEWQICKMCDQGRRSPWCEKEWTEWVTNLLFRPKMSKIEYPKCVAVGRYAYFFMRHSCFSCTFNPNCYKLQSNLWQIAGAHGHSLWNIDWIEKISQYDDVLSSAAV